MLPALSCIFGARLRPQQRSLERDMPLEPPARIRSSSPEKPTSRFDWGHIIERSRAWAAGCASAYERSRFYGNDAVWGTLGRFGITRHVKQREYSCSDNGGEGGRGLAVLLVGAGDREYWLSRIVSTRLTVHVPLASSCNR